MALQFLGRGLLLGLAVAAPVGPIGVLCIRRTLARGRLIGLLTGLGAATVDAFYSAVAAFGLSLVSLLLLRLRFWIALLGGLFLLYLGARGVFAHPPGDAVMASDAERAPGGLASAYGSALLLTLANPATILSFAAIFAGLGLVTTRGQRSAAVALVVGVFLGSTLWWVLLSGAVSLLRAKLSPTHLRRIARGSGLLLLGFGIAALVSALG